MTLTVLDMEQRSDEWYEARRGIVTASIVGQLITTKTMKPADNDTSRAVVAQLVAERILGVSEDNYVSRDMWRGVESEPFARDLYELHYAPVTEVGFMRLDMDGCTLGFSPDGLVGNHGFIEIKAPRAKEHIRTILADQVPSSYMAQIQAGLLVTGRQWCDYLSYCGGLPLYVKRVTPDEKWRTAIVAACEKFEIEAARMLDEFTAATQHLHPTERIDLEVVV